MQYGDLECTIIIQLNTKNVYMQDLESVCSAPKLAEQATALNVDYSAAVLSAAVECTNSGI